MENTCQNVDSYIDSFPQKIKERLLQIRANIKTFVPEAIESISYGMPAYKLNNKPLIYFAAFKKHIGFYATPSGHEEFKKELSVYKQGKGSVQFPLNEDLPMDLIKKIIVWKKDFILNSL